MTGPTRPAIVDLSFPRRWQAEVLSARPLILPTRHFVYPAQAEEVEHGAMELLIRPAVEVGVGTHAGVCEVPPFRFRQEDGERVANGASMRSMHSPEPFLATCALGFLDPAVPTGIWSTPNPEEICAVSGGYAYLIDTAAPERFTMVPYRPVLEIRPLPAHGLLLFVSHRSILAWGRNGQAWQAEKLSSEGVAIASIEGSVLRGLGWDLLTAREFPFALDLDTGLRVS